MSAMKMINEIKVQGGEIISFKSHCGGLVSPESDDNPWHYKITWNPANVVMAGSAGGVYRSEGKTIEIPYAQLFDDLNNFVDIPGLFPLAWYANRDSLAYLETYHLDDTKTFMRTTLRYPSFCRGWNKIIQLDLTNKNDHKEIEACRTFNEWFQIKKSKLISQKETQIISKNFFDEEFLTQISFLQLNKNGKIPFEAFNSASLLQYLLEQNLVMDHDDKDMIVMLHEIEYSLNGKNKLQRNCLIVKGEDHIHTAMAKTVGLPLGIAAKLILENKIHLTGLHIPVVPEIYQPVLKELELNEIKFNEVTINL